MTGRIERGRDSWEDMNVANGDDEVDVAVVGGGLAGWIAAVRAQELGAQVTLIERSARGPGWGNSIISGGVMHAALGSPYLLAGALLEKIESATDGTTDPAVARAWSEGAADTLEWIKTHGGDLIIDGPAAHRFAVLAPPRKGEPGLKFAQTGVYLFLTTLSREFVAGGGRLLQPARARGLRSIGLDHWELDVEAAGGHVRVLSKTVVLADGGFQANPALLRQFIGTDKVKRRAAGTSTGDALRMGQSVGVALVQMSGFYGHLLVRQALKDARFWPYPILDGLSKVGIVVDATGHRFVDETYAGVSTANAIARSVSPDGCWLLIDEAIWEKEGRIGSTPPNPYLVDEHAGPLRANTRGKLAKMMGVDPVALELSVHQARTDPDHAAPPRAKPVIFGHGPFLAFPLIAGVSFMLGGLRVDGHARVLDESGSQISGLYAAGGAMGGLHGGPHDGYVGGLLEAAVFGLLAGTDAASSRAESPAAH
jgi:fumarate reductase flavoprotein subunit